MCLHSRCSYLKCCSLLDRAVISSPQVLCDIEASVITLRTDAENNFAAVRVEATKLKGDLTAHVNKTEHDLSLLSGELHAKWAADVANLNHEANLYRVDLNSRVDQLRTDLSASHAELDTGLKALEREVQESIVDHKLSEEAEFMALNDRITTVQKELNGAIAEGVGNVQDQVTALQGEMAKAKNTLEAHGDQLVAAQSLLGEHGAAIGRLEEKTGRHYERLDEHQLELTAHATKLQVRAALPQACCYHVCCCMTVCLTVVHSAVFRCDQAGNVTCSCLSSLPYHSSYTV